MDLLGTVEVVKLFHQRSDCRPLARRADSGSGSGDRHGISLTTPGLTVDNEIRFHYGVAKIGGWLTSGVLVFAVIATTSACTTADARDRDGAIQVVAAESSWGSIAAQLGGTHVDVTSIVVNPDADPHDYEPTTRDSRELASADVVVINGLGYDSWASKVVAANPNPNQTVLTVGDVLGLPSDSNPHRWYNPSDVFAVADSITAAYQRFDPTNAAYYAQQKVSFDTTLTADYRATIARIKSGFGGTAVGASESIFAMLAPALGLHLVTPTRSFARSLRAATVSAADKRTIDRQIAHARSRSTSTTARTRRLTSRRSSARP